MKDVGIALLLGWSVACSGSISGGLMSGDSDAGSGVGHGGGDADAAPCAEVAVQVGAVTPTVLILIDRSGSMSDPFGADTRWNAVYGALMDPATGLVAALQSQVRFGVATYSASDLNNDGTVEGTCPAVDLVAPALANYDAINAVYAPLAPLDETPTGESLVVANAALAAVTAVGPKILVLATDGEPDTCAIPNPNGSAQGRAASLSAVEAGFAAGIRTYVISVGGEAVGNPDADKHMHELANAGLGKTPLAPDAAPLYQADDPAGLVAALGTIVAGVRTCSFTLDGTINLEQAAAGTVTLDGAALTYGSEWHLTDPHTLELVGDACATVLSGGNHDVHATFTCGAIVE